MRFYQKFAEYVLKAIERKMKALLSDELRKEVYDPEGQTEKGVCLFKFNNRFKI